MAFTPLRVISTGDMIPGRLFCVGPATFRIYSEAPLHLDPDGMSPGDDSRACVNGLTTGIPALYVSRRNGLSNRV